MLRLGKWLCSWLLCTQVFDLLLCPLRVEIIPGMGMLPGLDPTRPFDFLPVQLPQKLTFWDTGLLPTVWINPSLGFLLCADPRS